MNKFGLFLGVAGLCLAVNTASAAVDVDAAKSLMKKSGCFKCHSGDKKKDGPPYHEVAVKFRDRPEAEDTLFKHLTTKPKIKADGKEEEHITLKTKDEAEIRNVIHWILSL